VYISVNLHILAFKYGFSTLFCLIPVLFQSYSSGIPEESCHSCGIPVEWQDSCRNRWGTVKYCPQREHPSRWFLDPTIQSSSKALALQGFVVSKEHHKQKRKNEKSCVWKPNPEPVSFRGGRMNLSRMMWFDDNVYSKLPVIMSFGWDFFSERSRLSMRSYEC